MPRPVLFSPSSSTCTASVVRKVIDGAHSSAIDTRLRSLKWVKALQKILDHHLRSMFLLGTFQSGSKHGIPPNSYAAAKHQFDSLQT